MRDFSDGANDDASGGSGNGPGGSDGGPGGPGIPGSPGSPTAAFFGGGPGNPDDDDEIHEILIDYNEKYANAQPALFRDQIIDQTMVVLTSYTKNNALLIGDAGTGKTRIVEEIARRIANDDPSVPMALKDHTVYELPWASIISGTGIRGALEAKLNAIIDFATNPDNKAIIFMDEIHMIAPNDAGGSSTHEEIANHLKPALARGEIKFIAATTTQEGRRIDSDPAFKRRFSQVTVSEFNQAQTQEILANAYPQMVAHFGGRTTIDPTMFPYIVDAADEGLSSISRPDNALTLMDRTMSMATLSIDRAIKSNYVPPSSKIAIAESHVDNALQRLITGDATTTRIDLDLLNQDLCRIVGQDHVRTELVDRMTRDSLNLFPRSRPISMLFAGSSGVGKTETARILAEHVMGTEPIILRGGEFSEPSTVNRIIGSPPGYVGSTSNKPLPLDPLQTNPRQVILFDEAEKADRKVMRLLLNALDEGKIQMASGRVVDTSKAIFMFTTNAARDKFNVVSGSDHSSGFGFAGGGTDGGLGSDKIAKELSQFFDKEFLGRIDWLCAFNRIGREDYTTIVTQTYARMRTEACRRRPSMDSVLPKKIPACDLAHIVAESYLPDHGARPAMRHVRKYIEDFVMRAPSTGALYGNGDSGDDDAAAVSSVDDVAPVMTSDR